jgi:hypothetical protein
MVNSVFTLLRIILGDFDFPGMVKSQPILGPLYFVTYVLAIFFILLVSDNFLILIVLLNPKTHGLLGRVFSEK